jgi:cleavage and polyadenylation specificity factor subunit 1
VASLNGQMLISRADFHTGLFVTRTVRLPPLPVPAAGGVPERRRGVLLGSREGAVGCVGPLSEATYRRLHALQSRMVTTLPHGAGLNPRAFRFADAGRENRWADTDTDAVVQNVPE